MKRGKVSIVEDEFGYIIRADNYERILFRSPEEDVTLRSGQEVEFELIDEGPEPRAVNVTPVDSE